MSTVRYPGHHAHVDTAAIAARAADSTSTDRDVADLLALTDRLQHMLARDRRSRRRLR